MNKFLMEENYRLQKQVSQLVYDNGCFRQHTQNVSSNFPLCWATACIDPKLISSVTISSADPSCESAVTSGQHCMTQQNPPGDASHAGLLSIAEETLAEFLSKATGTAIEWVQMPGMKPGQWSGFHRNHCYLSWLPWSGSTCLWPCGSRTYTGCRTPSWFRDCRAVDVLNVLPTANGGTIELLYMQLYAPTTLAPASDFW
ncbi:homeobox-leucine zipper protein ATHB-15-like [Hibiscus syriacus]|uniref:homeobox-leucine zipper protein ATHB-15-like n=1 Tax=Hibiscus syriacus TaxID=106335 RepID=UPI00192488DD|nr:homeobox-leucine zipper protein ATHB-15-like [Hibiscus syriacus]